MTTSDTPMLFEHHNVRISGNGPVTVVLAHGYGCDQGMWRLLVPELDKHYRVVLFDHVGAGAARAPWDPVRHGSLDGYADDVLAICRALGPEPVVFIGHSASASIGVLAASRQPELFARLVLITPSPRYIDDAEYVGGFSEEDIEALLGLLQADHNGWAAAMAPTIMGNPDRPELAAELAGTFCRQDPAVAVGFARATFTADNRADFARVRTACLVLHCRDDAISPASVMDFVQHCLPASVLVQLDATGHCPHLSAPRETAEAINAYLADLLPRA
jgi:sigma-B regulation protein RsbQ